MPYKEVQYRFNPFTDRLARIVVDYRHDYLAIGSQFEERWGPPAESAEKAAPVDPFLGPGTEVRKSWSRDGVEVLLVYTRFESYPNEASRGRVEYRSTKQLDLMKSLSEKLGTARRSRNPPPTTRRSRPSPASSTSSRRLDPGPCRSR